MKSINHAMLYKNLNMKMRFKNLNIRFTPVTALIALANFGMRSMNFIQSLLTVGSTPFENLNRGQVRQMWWLQCMYR